MSKKFMLVLAVFILVLTQSLFASGGQLTPWEEPLQRVLNALSGNTVKIIGGLMIVGAGIAMAATEGQATKKVFWVIIGVGIAVNAISFMTQFFGGTSGALI